MGSSSGRPRCDASGPLYYTERYAYRLPTVHYLPAMSDTDIEALIVSASHIQAVKVRFVVRLFKSIEHLSVVLDEYALPSYQKDDLLTFIGRGSCQLSGSGQHCSSLVHAWADLNLRFTITA